MTLRLGLVGRGRWGRNIERTLVSFGGVSVAVIGRGEARRHDIDGVLIASPSATHAALALPYIEAGIATFIEKPMATSVADAERIQAAANRSGAVVFVGHLHLHNPAFLAALKVLPALGAVRYVHCHSANGNPRADCSVLWDWLPHHLATARAVFGRNPVVAQCWTLADAPLCQAAVSRYDFGGVSLVSMVSWLSPVSRQQMTIAADKGSLFFDDKAERKLIVHGPDGRASYPAYDNSLPLTDELQAFVAAVRSGIADPSHVALGVAIAQAIAAAEDSMAAHGAAVDIED
jgi:predicted dehydrogenase